MIARDLIGLTSETLRMHRLRTVLTLTATAVGVVAVLVLTSLGEGARDYVVGEFAGMGTNVLFVVPGKIETIGGAPPIGGGTKDLTLEDWEAITRRCSAVRRAAPVAFGSAAVAYGGRSRTGIVIGSTPEVREIRNLTVAAGRFLPAGDPRRDEPVAVMGRTMQREIFGSENPLGRSIRIGERRFRVIGVTDRKGQSLGVDMDDVVLIPVTTAMNLFDQTSLFRILIQAKSSTDVETARDQVLAVLRERHGEEDVTVITQGAVLTTFRSILNTLTMALAGIAAVSLAVAGIGIMNVMLVSVSERTSEVGLLKALGARRRQILTVFLIEALLLAIAGTVAGIAIGVAATLVGAAVLPDFPLRPNPVWIGAVLLLALAAGVGFGMLPARRAARVDAAEALRGRIG
jgi:putative ABC transport system permease protein